MTAPKQPYELPPVWCQIVVDEKTELHAAVQVPHSPRRTASLQIGDVAAVIVKSPHAAVLLGRALLQLADDMAGPADDDGAHLAARPTSAGGRLEVVRDR